MTENEKLRALLAEALDALTYHVNEAEQRHEKERLIRPDRDLTNRIDAALAEPVPDEPAVIRFSSPVYACLDCGHCDDGLTLTWRDGESTKAMCLKCRQNRVENIEGSVLALVRERDEARAEVERAYRRGAEAMREAAAQGLDRLLTKKKATAIWVSPDEIRTLPLPEDK